MTSLVLSPNASGSGSLTIAAPNTASNITFNLPTTIGNAGTSAVVTTDASGNLGIGVAPSAWGALFKAVQLPGGSVWADSNNLYASSNTYYNGTNYIYKNSTYATSYEQAGGSHAWKIAASGTAGNAITFTTAMTLDASGVLNISGAVGTSWSPAYNGPSISRNGTDNYVTTYYDDSSITIGAGVTQKTGIGIYGQSHANGNYIAFRAGNNERVRITSGGDLLVGTTSGSFSQVSKNGTYAFGVAQTGVGNNVLLVDGAYSAGTQNLVVFAKSGTTTGTITYNGSAVAYNTTSDYRLKDNPQPLTGSGAFIDALQPKTWNWKTDGSRGVGFIAHEAQAVSPGSVVGEKDAVDADGNPVMQAMEYGSAEFIANIIAELQSLRARVAALEAL